MAEEDEVERPRDRQTKSCSSSNKNDKYIDSNLETGPRGLKTNMTNLHKKYIDHLLITIAIILLYNYH